MGSLAYWMGPLPGDIPSGNLFLFQGNLIQGRYSRARCHYSQEKCACPVIKRSLLIACSVLETFLKTTGWTAARETVGDRSCVKDQVDTGLYWGLRPGVMGVGRKTLPVFTPKSADMCHGSKR